MKRPRRDDRRGRFAITGWILRWLVTVSGPFVCEFLQRPAALAHCLNRALIRANHLNREAVVLERTDNVGYEFEFEPVCPAFVGCLTGNICAEVQSRGTSRRRVDKALRAAGDAPFDNDPIVARTIEKGTPVSDPPQKRGRIEFWGVGKCLAHGFRPLTRVGSRGVVSGIPGTAPRPSHRPPDGLLRA
jgi:hypothetical protein